jgi:hypothetical protein
MNKKSNEKKFKLIPLSAKENSNMPNAFARPKKEIIIKATN